VSHAYPADLAQVLRTQWDHPRGPASMQPRPPSVLPRACPTPLCSKTSWC